MARTMFILVTDDQGIVDKARTWGQSNGLTSQVYSTTDWQRGMGDPSFCKGLQEGGSPSLSSGTSPVNNGAKILPFPGPAGKGDKKVQTINELESIAIENAIFEFGGNLTEAAKALGIGRATLYRKVKQYNIDPSQARKKRVA